MNGEPRSSGSSISRDKVSWDISVPKGLQKLPKGRAIQSEIRFVVNNHSDSTLDILIRVRSPSNILVFKSTRQKKMGPGMIKKERKNVIGVQKQRINQGGQKTFVFVFLFRPHLARLRESSLTLDYVISGYNEDGQHLIQLGPYSLDLPISTSK
ncbi:MAG: hypothetical protein ACFFBX_02380 [Promethearchaeota archaeon]